MTLGKVLKEARQRHKMTLRDVERATGISNGYLSLLESDSVKSPSPNHLHQLSETYGCQYSLLMELAGYVVPEPKAERPWMEGIDETGDLTADEMSQVRSFVGYLRAQRPPGPQDN